MASRTGFSLNELLFTVVFLALAGAILVGLAPNPRGPLPQTYNNLRQIGQAVAEYRADYQDYFPITLSYTRGAIQRPGVSLEGWCIWSFGGKNNHFFWGSRAFDVEAADRPLNPYVIPDEYFYAPAIPTRLPSNHPARTQAQAPMFNDPGDIGTFQRNYPARDTSVSGYNDIGTSYVSNMAWWDQLPPSMPFAARFNEGARRLAVGQGVQPSRFVWMTDQMATVVSYNPSSRFKILNGYGDTNFSPLLFVDGHATYERIIPNRQTTPDYTFRFEP